MVGQRLMKAIANKPTDRDVDLRLPHEPAIVHDTEQETRKHQANGYFRIDTRTAIVGTVEVSDLRAQPGQVQHAVDPRENMIIGNQLSERSRHEQFQLTTLFASQHCSPSRINDRSSESADQDFFNGPTLQRCQVAERTLETAAFMPSCASETTSLTPRRPRLVSLRRNSVQI